MTVPAAGAPVAGEGAEAASPWSPVVPAASVGGADGGGDVTLVEGQTFCLSARSGDIEPDVAQGLFLLDTRILSRWQLRVNGHPLETLAVAVTAPFAATFVGRGAPGANGADADLVVIRHRHVGRGMRERVVVTNHGLQATAVTIDADVDVDFADLFEVKDGRVQRRGRHAQALDGQDLRFSHDDARRGQRQVTVHSSAAGELRPGAIRWRRRLAPGEQWELCLEVGVQLGDNAIEARFRCGVTDELMVPSRRLASWRARLPTVATDNADLAGALARSGEDLGALRIFDPEHPDVPIVAAGAPWFMTVFGRDSLLTAWMTLPADPSLARGVLETLARFQGAEVDDGTEEEPGKILHEMRFGASHDLALGDGDVYYGSVDATPLFVMLLGELRRWGVDGDVIDRLLPAADRALDWIERFGDRDGDGYVEYERRNPDGLANQGWKDSWDAVRFADGELARTPIALCEVQGYVYAAYVARAHFARESGDDVTFARYRAKAAELRRRFNEDFWLDDRGCFALALDADKRPVDAVASNMGHCLWTGIVEPERAGPVADRLLSDELFSGWGVRTLAASMAAYNPVSYHNGSVWPHDNALCAAGLARYGFVDHAHRVIEAQLAVAARTARLPELFAGLGRDEVPVPAAYPASCSPQAWAAAAPLSWLRTILRLDPWVSQGQVWIAPELPPSLHHLEVQGIEIAGHNLSVSVRDGIVDVDLDGPFEVMRSARPPLTAT